jgi:HlyD family secretion protein
MILRWGGFRPTGVSRNGLKKMKIELNFARFFTTQKKLLIIIGAALLVLIIAAVVLLPMFTRGAEEPQMQIGTVTTGTLSETVDGYGTLEAQPSSTLVWNSDGVVGEFELKVGDTVKQGDVLMELEPSSQSATILNAYSDLLDAQNDLNLLTAADSTYQSTLSDLVYQQKMLINKRADKMAWDYGHSSMERIDAVRDNYYAARAEVWNLEAAYEEVKSLEENDPTRVAAYEALQQGIVKRDSLNRALGQILGVPFDIPVETDFIEYDQQVAKVSEAEVAYNRYVDSNKEINAAQAKVQSLQNTVNKAKIIAPFDGTITSISAVAGDVVSNGDEAVRIDDLSNLIVTMQVSQEDVNKIEVGQDAEITFDAISDKEYTGFVESISSSGEANSYGIVYFSVVVKIEDADDAVKPGFTAVAKIVVSQAESTLLVPNDALVTKEDGTYAVNIISDDGSRKSIDVEIGVKTDTNTQIISDQIKEGDKVVLFTNSDSSQNASSNRRRGGGLFGMFGMGGGPRGPR